MQFLAQSSDNCVQLSQCIHCTNERVHCLHEIILQNIKYSKQINNLLCACVRTSTETTPRPFIHTYCLIDWQYYVQSAPLACKLADYQVPILYKPSRRTFFPLIPGLQQAETLAITRDGNHDHHFSIEKRAVQRPLCKLNLPKLNVQALGMTTFRTIQLITLIHVTSAL